MKAFRIIFGLLIFAFVVAAASGLNSLFKEIDNVIDGSSSVAPPSSEKDDTETNTPTDSEKPTNPDEPIEECSHTYSEGVCSKCGKECSHVWNGSDFCSICGQSALPEMPAPDVTCSHTFVDGVCSKCGERELVRV